MIYSKFTRICLTLSYIFFLIMLLSGMLVPIINYTSDVFCASAGLTVIAYILYRISKWLDELEALGEF